MIEQKIEKLLVKLMRICGLGEVLAEIESVSGVETETVTEEAITTVNLDNILDFS